MPFNNNFDKFHLLSEIGRELKIMRIIFIGNIYSIDFEFVVMLDEIIT